LITGLARERERWTEDRINLLDKYDKLVGDCLTSSAFLSYAGPFDFFFRKRMIEETWRQDVVKRGLPYSEDFTI